MENAVKITCNLSTSDSSVPLGLEIWLDDQQIFNQEWVTESVEFCYELSDADAEHELRFVMKNKTAQHTAIDLNGNIVKDAWLIVNDLAFDEIMLGNTVTNLAVYTHDFNGTGNQIQDKFYETLGCNGTVSLKFTTPVYLWLLENY
jgi:hypothetical protein